MVIVTKYSDSTYSITNGSVIVGPVSRSTLISKAVWLYGLDKKVITSNLTTLDNSNNDVLLYENNNIVYTKFKNLLGLLQK